MTYDEMIARGEASALYEIAYADGVCIGCGTQAEIEQLQADGIFGCEASDLRMKRIA